MFDYHAWPCTLISPLSLGEVEEGRRAGEAEDDRTDSSTSFTTTDSFINEENPRILNLKIHQNGSLRQLGFS